MNGLRILVNIAQHPNWALDSLCHYISSKHGFYVLKPCQALLNWQGFREGTIQTSGKFSLLLSVRRLKVYSFNRERWNNFWKLSLISILNAQFLGKHNTQWSFSNMLISLVINVVFQQCLCSLNLYLKIKVWIYIFMCEKNLQKKWKWIPGHTLQVIYWLEIRHFHDPRSLFLVRPIALLKWRKVLMSQPHLGLPAGHFEW